jgi:NAD(P)-dependent dehydrogenase (short-subunit alcohol dehydrogenase family)
MASSSSSTRVALITGAASGIGRHLAFLLARDGYRIAGIDLQPEALVSLADELKRQGCACATAVADVTRSGELSQAIAGLEAQLGPSDLLIASAGIGIETSGLAYSADDIARVININLIGVSNSIAAVLPGMLERGRGHLVALSSVASLRGLPRMLAYCASKAGLNSLMEGLRVELRPRGIAVTTICPGWIKTPMTAKIEGRLAYLMEVEDAAREIAAAIRKKLPIYIFPRPMRWQMRVLGWLPTSMQDRVIVRMLSRLEAKGEQPRAASDSKPS